MRIIAAKIDSTCYWIMGFIMVFYRTPHLLSYICSKTSCKSVNMHHKNTEKHNPSLTTNISLQQLSCCFNTIVFVHYYVLLNMLQEKAYYGLHRHFTPLRIPNTCFLPPDLKACKKKQKTPQCLWHSPRSQ